ncbi:MAG: NAD-dependent epimerase/dehydratase family protein [Acidobacteriota bacterium]
MRIAIIGATGMIGHHTAIAVLERGHQLVVVHRKNSNLNSLSDLKFSSAVADLNDQKALQEAFTDVDAVINCAAYYPTKPLPWRAEVETAISQMENFYNACSDIKLQKIVYLGAAIALPKHPLGQPGNEDLIYPDRPSDKTPYVQVKWEMDRIARERAKAGLPVVIGVPSMCFGEFDYGPSTGRLIVEIANRTLPGYLKGNRNIIYAGDAGHGLVLACEKGRVGERYLFTGTNISMDELVPLIAEIARVAAPKKVIPLSAAKLLSKLQESRFKLLGGELPRLSSTAIAVMASGQFLNGDKAKNELGFSCRLDLKETLSRTLQWFSHNGYIR